MNNLFIENVTLDETGKFFSSDLIKPTESQIKEFKSKPCDHDLNVDKLVYDENNGAGYSSRYCGVCNEFIDII